MISLLAKELGEERCKRWAQKESVDKVVEEEMNEQVWKVQWDFCLSYVRYLYYMEVWSLEPTEYKGFPNN